MSPNRTSESAGTRRLPWLNQPIGYALHFCAVSLVLLPLCLAGVGALVEGFVYKPAYNPHFHVKWMPISALIAAPFILVRVLWRWPQHLRKLEILIYLVQTIAYSIAVGQSVIVGQSYYIANSGVRDLLTTDSTGVDLFNSIKDEDGVWNWLDHAVGTLYSSDARRGYTARALKNTRIIVATSIKIRQHRVTPVCCSPFFNMAFSNGQDECYPLYSRDAESKADYGTNLTFQYSDKATSTSSGYDLDPYSYTMDGAFGTYPLAGFTTYFPTGILRKTALNQLRAMRDSNWIDPQTRSVSVELALMSPDYIKKPIWAAATFLIERDHIGRFAPYPPSVHFNFFDINKASVEQSGGKPLTTCRNLSFPLAVNANTTFSAADNFTGSSSFNVCNVNEPGPAVVFLYAAILPFVIYTLFNAVMGLLDNWRAFIRQPFNLTNLAWASLLLVVLGYYMAVARATECSFIFERQATFSGVGNDTVEGLLSERPPRNEFVPLADLLTNSKRFLAISIFVHFFNSLRFLVRLKSLGIMVRTLYFAGSALFSFSISFLAMFFGFVLMFYYIYSLDVESFQSVPRTIATLWLGMLGEVQLTAELWRARDWTISLFILFTFTSVFVLLTMIISIISEAHQKAQQEARSERSPPDSQIRGGTQDALPRTSAANAIPGAAAVNSDFTNLVSESDIINSAVNKWKEVRLRGKTAQVSPYDDQVALQDTATNACGQSSTDLTQPTADAQSLASLYQTAHEQQAHTQNSNPIQNATSAV